jgi:hypothetical protein
MNRIANKASQIWALAKKIQEGDLVALPLKRRAAVAFGEVTGPYKYRMDLSDETHPVRKVDKDRRAEVLAGSGHPGLAGLSSDRGADQAQQHRGTHQGGGRPPVVPHSPGPVVEDDEVIVTDTVGVILSAWRH